MQIVEAMLIVLISCLIYLAFGSLVCVNRNKDFSGVITLVVGFFAYYALFFVVCLPIMITYRPLSLLTKCWSCVVIVVVVIAIVIAGRTWINKIKSLITYVKQSPVIIGITLLLIVIQIVLVTSTYNFTLDAAYYVANVATSVNTNMINVYDPFTGAWQDHFELRYAFATYSIHDAVVCQLTGIPALVQTKMVMSAIVMLISNLLYVWLCKFMCAENRRKGLIMYLFMVVINFTFITIYTSSNFLMNRTYEGKSIVGNIAVIAVFAIYMMAVRRDLKIRDFAMLFTICLGTATVSSTANMLLPAQICILFVPYVIRRKAIKLIPGFLICMLPEVVMMLMYVLYVKGYFAIYTYPR